MKKKTKRWMGALLVGVVAVVAGYNVYLSQKHDVKLNDLALANVDALAQNGSDYTQGIDVRRGSVKVIVNSWNASVGISLGNKGFSFNLGSSSTSIACCKDVGDPMSGCDYAMEDPLCKH
ncbi:MAG: NVEALA domain-containing protein [Mediterranea sp.]|jgi:hypothetical protein|nr:NVEALA domain-containing protein [Mediterranea sp.]